MLPNLPPLLEHQTLYSWCGIAHAWSGGTNALATSQHLFGTPYAALSHDFPSHLSKLQKNAPELFSDIGTLALKHTLLGYFLPFCTTGIADLVLNRTAEGMMPELKMKLGITASRVGGHHPLKGCTKCFDEDEASFGVAYWRIEHQFPSSVVCRRHALPLSIAWDPTTPVHRRGWLLPRNGPNRSWVSIHVDSDSQMDLLLRLSAYSEQLSEMAPAALDGAALARSYQSVLRAQGLLTANGSLRLSSLTKRARDFYRGVETIPGFSTLRSITEDWPGFVGALIRRKPRNGHPLKHVLVIAMLFDTWKEFTLRYDENRLPSPLLQPAPMAAKDRALEQKFRHLVKNKGETIRSAAAQVGVCTATGVLWANRYGIDYVARTKTLTPQRLEKAKQLLRSGTSAKETAVVTRISSASVNRLLGADRKLRKDWKLAQFQFRRTRARRAFKSCVKNHPGEPISDIRRVPENSFMWLYRNDQEWLHRNSPTISLVKKHP